MSKQNKNATPYYTVEGFERTVSYGVTFFIKHLEPHTQDFKTYIRDDGDPVTRQLASAEAMLALSKRPNWHGVTVTLRDDRQRLIKNRKVVVFTHERGV